MIPVELELYRAGLMQLSVAERIAAVEASEGVRVTTGTRMEIDDQDTCDLCLEIRGQTFSVEDKHAMEMYSGLMHDNCRGDIYWTYSTQKFQPEVNWVDPSQELIKKFYGKPVEGALGSLFGVQKPPLGAFFDREVQVGMKAYEDALVSGATKADASKALSEAINAVSRKTLTVDELTYIHRKAKSEFKRLGLEGVVEGRKAIQ